MKVRHLGGTRGLSKLPHEIDATCVAYAVVAPQNERLQIRGCTVTERLCESGCPLVSRGTATRQSQRPQPSQLRGRVLAGQTRRNVVEDAGRIGHRDQLDM